MATTLEERVARAQERSARPGRRLQLKPGMPAAAGLLAAVGASACCILPLGLVMLGVTGAWLGRLTALAPYQPIFVVIAVAALAAGYGVVYRQTPRCDPGAACARPVAGGIVKGALWAATALVAAALAFPHAVRWLPGA